MRTAQKRANIENIQKLVVNNGVVDNRPLIALVMRECQVTLQEIADTMGYTRQMADTMIKKARTSYEQAH